MSASVCSRAVRKVIAGIVEGLREDAPLRLARSHREARPKWGLLATFSVRHRTVLASTSRLGTKPVRQLQEMPLCRSLKISSWRHVPSGIHHHDLSIVIVPVLAGLRTDYRKAARSMKSSTDGHGSRHGKTSARQDVRPHTNKPIESRSQGESSGLWLTLCILVATCA